MTRDPVALAAKALEGHQAAGARLIRMLEERDEAALEGLRALYPAAGRARLLGVTGPPGAGKSTLVDRIVGELRRREHRVGVIAVDPSSPFTGGAILGDRVRMQTHATDPDVFIRSMATRGQLGGLARAAFEATTVLDAMGYDRIVIETVGVGQDEVDVVELAHTTAVVAIPGMGDDIQALKAGILEIGDIFVVNKADLPGADRVLNQLSAMLHLRAPSNGPEHASWEPPVLLTQAEQARGIEELVDAFDAHGDFLDATGGRARSVGQLRERLFQDLLRERASEKVLQAVPGGREALVAAVRRGELDPYAAVEEVLGENAQGLKHKAGTPHSAG